MIEKYALEWSRKQNCFHIQKLSDALADAQRRFIENANNDYLIMFVGPINSCHEMADAHRGKLIARAPRELVAA